MTVRVGEDLDCFYIVKIVSESYNPKQLRNYSTKLHNVLYVMTIDKSNRCLVSWSNEKIIADIINDSYLFIYTRSLAYIKIIETMWRHLFSDKALYLEKVNLSSNSRIDTRISQDLLDFTFKDEGLHIELLCLEDNIDVLYAKDGLVRYTVSEDHTVSEKVKEITQLLLKRE